MSLNWDKNNQNRRLQQEGKFDKFPFPKPKTKPKIDLNPKFRMGKYKGQLINEVWKEDKSYCQWFFLTIPPKNQGTSIWFLLSTKIKAYYMETYYS